MGSPPVEVHICGHAYATSMDLESFQENSWVI
jgi:hypothetical protein